MDADEHDELRRREVTALETTARFTEYIARNTNYLPLIVLALYIIAIGNCTGKLLR